MEPRVLLDGIGSDAMTAAALSPQPAPPPAAGAAPESDRIAALDTLRGVAVLGILVMNIQSFSMVGAAYENPTAWGDLHGVNYAVWLLGHVLADQKFMTIFAMLFGAGVVLSTGRQEEAAGRSARYHYRRMAVLLLFGLCHAYLLWYGDILTGYALCGMAVYPLRKVRPSRLLVTGAVLLAVPAVLFGLLYGTMPMWGSKDLEEFEQLWRPTAEQMAKETDAYRGGWVAQMPERVPAAMWMQTLGFVFFVFWRAAGLMLIGMGLFRLGVFSARCRAAVYATFLALGVAVGVPAVVYGQWRIEASGWDAGYSLFVGGQYNYWASVLVSLGWVGLVMLLVQSGRWQPLTRRLAAVGRLALTNYLAETLICTTLFYGHGLGLFGRVERLGQLGIVFAVWAVLLLVSPLWLRYFRFGPAEWLWRLLTYGKLPPLRRGTSVTAMPADG